MHASLMLFLINHLLERNVSYINSNDLQLNKRVHHLVLYKKASTLNYEETDMKVEFKLSMIQRTLLMLQS